MSVPVAGQGRSQEHPAQPRAAQTVPAAAARTDSAAWHPPQGPSGERHLRCHITRAAEPAKAHPALLPCPLLAALCLLHRPKKNEAFCSSLDSQSNALPCHQLHSKSIPEFKSSVIFKSFATPESLALIQERFTLIPPPNPKNVKNFPLALSSSLQQPGAG